MIRFRPHRHVDHAELRKMMHALSREDPSTERITDKKISRTFRELSRKPNRGRIVVFEKAKAIIGYAF